DDLVESFVDLLLGHPVQGADQVDVLASGEDFVERGPQLQQRGDLATDTDLALIGDEHPGDQLEHRRFARTVLADDSLAVALLNLEGHDTQRPELVTIGVGVPFVAVDEHLTQAAFAATVHRELDTEPLGLDDRSFGIRGVGGGLRHHNSFRTDISKRRNVQYPMTSIRIEPTTEEHNASAVGVNSSNPENHTVRCISKIPSNGLSW